MSSQMGDVSFTDVKFIIQYVGAKLCAEQWEHILHRSSDHFVNWCQKWFQMTTRSKKMRFWDGVIWLIGFEDRKFWLALEDVIFILHGVQWHKLLSQSPVVTRNGAPGRQCCEGLVATTIGQFEGHEQYKSRVNQQLQTTRESLKKILSSRFYILCSWSGNQGFSVILKDILHCTAIALTQTPIDLVGYWIPAEIQLHQLSYIKVGHLLEDWDSKLEVNLLRRIRLTSRTWTPDSPWNSLPSKQALSSLRVEAFQVLLEDTVMLSTQMVT